MRIFIIIVALFVAAFAFLVHVQMSDSARDKVGLKACHARGMQRVSANFVDFCVSPTGQVFFFRDAQTNRVIVE